MSRTDDLLRQHEPLAVGIAHKALRRMPRSVDPDEVMQIARIGLWRAIQKHDPAKASLPTFITRTVKWKIMDWQREQFVWHYETCRRHKHVLPALRPLDDARAVRAVDGDPATRAETADDLARLAAAINDLPPRRRGILLACMRGDDRRAVAEKYQTSTRCIQSTYSQVRKHLREVFAKVPIAKHRAIVRCRQTVQAH